MKIIQEEGLGQGKKKNEKPKLTYDTCGMCFVTMGSSVRRRLEIRKVRSNGIRMWSAFLWVIGSQ